MYRSSRRIAIYRSQDPRLRIHKQFGGALLKRSNAKKARPLSAKHAMHVVLRSSQAKAIWSFRHQHNWKKVTAILTNQARKYGIQLREQVNGGDHLQLVVKVKKREAFNGFVRAVSGMIAMAITDSAKTRALKNKFWDYRPWTQIIAAVRNYLIARDAILQKYLVDSEILNFKEAPA